MRNSYAPIPKKKRRANNFKPSSSLAEFAEMNDLDLFALEALVTNSTTINAQYSRGNTQYYHIVALRGLL